MRDVIVAVLVVHGLIVAAHPPGIFKPAAKPIGLKKPARVSWWWQVYLLSVSSFRKPGGAYYRLLGRWIPSSC